MDKKFGLYIVLGLFIGAIFGVSFTSVTHNDMLAISGGALAGVFIGWFIAATVRERTIHRQSQNTNDRTSKP
jgi:membrane associated rhomboid family serine protease